MPNLNDKQYSAIAILSQPKRGGLTYEQVADEVGISRRQLQEWRKDDAFNDELKRQIMRDTIDRLPEIMESIPDHIIKDGNAAMFRTLLQSFGMLTEKVEVETKNDSTSIEAMKADIERIRGK
ncbi:phBC6A51 family helix-turn-helix protein [Lysinibacillus xylanilyticus]|uniref:PhBC6A51 family helix-turn-helix protein n=1 Tax=Lysinibacillus xylanilyticus TaxID=582475 RepID=A0ABT4EMA4_9BACI|nr:phBC6A51 family helix-turn-helix protein [Lysinibacillus xylanilyticus]MCY9546793.1 phBC6A51 family helix-turn-helix protein [Lysinibacillus xylanilyticus]